jgi:hypothetical protein
MLDDFFVQYNCKHDFETFMLIVKFKSTNYILLNTVQKQVNFSQLLTN